MIRYNKHAHTPRVAFFALLAACVIILPLFVVPYVFSEFVFREPDTAVWSSIIVAISCIAGFVGYYIFRLLHPRIQPGCCPNCRYDLRGNPDGEACPECGHPIRDITYNYSNNADGI